MEYCNTDKIIIERSKKEVVYNMITKKHYANTWTASSDIYAIYYKSGEHRFFDGKELKLIGCVIYGNPVGFRVVKSISEELFYRNRSKLFWKYIKNVTQVEYFFLI